MSAGEESQAQRAARLRRERREAKLQTGGTARIDKITSLGGRTPAAETAKTSPVPERSSPPVTVPSSTSATPQQPSVSSSGIPEELNRQQESMRALLRSRESAPSDAPTEEDPIEKMLKTMLAGEPGSGISPDLVPSGVSWLSKTASFASSFASPPLQPKWDFLHVVFAVAIAVYLLFILQSSVQTYGTRPPSPATAQNPFALFIGGEIVLSSIRAAAARQRPGIGTFVWPLIRDGRVVLFVLGTAVWWSGEQAWGISE